MNHTKEELEAANESAGGLIDNDRTINPCYERNEHINGFIAGITYQKDRSYSKEDLEEKLDELLLIYRNAATEATHNADSSSMITWSAHIAAINDVKKTFGNLS